jgi:hypothetical protein
MKTLKANWELTTIITAVTLLTIVVVHNALVYGCHNPIASF